MPSASSERRVGSLRRRPPLRVVVAGQALGEAVGLGAGEETVHCRVASALVRALRGEKEYGSKYCLTAPSFLPESLCSKEDFLYIYCEQPTFFAFDCAQYPCECSIQRLNGVYVPLDKAATSVFWWPGSANKLGMEGGTIDKYHDVDSVRKQWHQIIITSHEAVLQCGITSESLNLSLHCPEDLGDDYNEYEHFMSRMFVGSYRGHEMTSSYWALGCDVTPSWCPDSAECAIPATKEKKEVQWWMKLVLAVEVIFLVIGLVWLGNGILFQVRRKRTQKREFNRQQRPTGDNKVQETKHL
ncbi:uncharacterized protein [Penaeus vannamei]|uniref:uncharacterized protein isoform X7 n=1 Tax=Penaeus vannamei TaxID=6689 RepID=UPI00387F60FB